MNPRRPGPSSCGGLCQTDSSIEKRQSGLNEPATFFKTHAGFQIFFSPHGIGTGGIFLPMYTQWLLQQACPATQSLPVLLKTQEQVGGLADIRFTGDGTIKDVDEIRIVLLPAHGTKGKKMGWMTGFEPATARATTWCSAKLSYIHRLAGRLTSFCRKSKQKYDWIFKR